jgi:hypothetical protein
MSNSSTYDYLIKQYIKLGLLDSAGNKTAGKNDWDPYIYPDDGYIPPCGICKLQYDEYTKRSNYADEIKWPHYKCGCLWSEYYEEKLLKLKEDIKFMKT